MFYKKLLLSTALGLSLVAAQAQSLNVPAPSPTQTLKQNFGTSDISLEYSRPSAKGRVVFGNVVDFSKVWRTGANSSTKITFADSVKVEGNAVAPGTYAIYSVPGKDMWEIMLYKDLKLGGNVGDYKKENEVLRFKVSPMRISDKVETFTINFNNITSTSTTLEMAWENTKVPVRITTDIDGKIMSKINEVLVKDNRPFFSAATYYYENGKDLNQAMAWVNKALDGNKDAYWIFLLKAKIAMKQNDVKGAMAAATESNRLAKLDGDDAYVKQSAELLAQLMKK